MMANILIIEDNDQVAQLIQDILAEDGHTTDRSAAAYEAIIRTTGTKYDLVIMDLLLQGDANGAVVGLALRGLGFQEPILVVTGNLIPIDKEAYDRVGFAGKLLKPFTAKDLKTMVQTLLEESK